MTATTNASQVISQRRTHKVIADINAPSRPSQSTTEDIDTLIDVAGNAPVHYACDRLHLSDMQSSMPWRAYKLGQGSCRNLMQYLLNAGDKTKVPNMLAAADFLVQVTWLPDAGTIRNSHGGKEETAFDGTIRNMEHIAAASSFIQSLLLAADDAGFRTYWSSGGALRSADVFQQLNIPETQLLLGSIFLFPQDVGGAEVKPGSMASKRGTFADWSRWVD